MGVAVDLAGVAADLAGSADLAPWHGALEMHPVGKALQNHSAVQMLAVEIGVKEEWMKTPQPEMKGC